MTWREDCSSRALKLLKLPLSVLAFFFLQFSKVDKLLTSCARLLQKISLSACCGRRGSSPTPTSVCRLQIVKRGGPINNWKSLSEHQYLRRMDLYQEEMISFLLYIYIMLWVHDKSIINQFKFQDPDYRFSNVDYLNLVSSVLFGYKLSFFYSFPQVLWPNDQAINLRFYTWFRN